jgi:hypothetical protein
MKQSRAPHGMNLGARLADCRELIANAERALGPLEPGQLSDLLLDNFEWIFDVAEAHELLVLIGRAPESFRRAG